jgi:ubiquinone biosynthesis protein UbiJ
MHISDEDRALLQRLKVNDDFVPQPILQLARLVDRIQARIDELERKRK